MNHAGKQELAASIKEDLAKAKVSIFVDYKGLKAAEADAFRKIIRDQEGKVQVIKNNIMRKAVADAEFGPEAEAVVEGVVGPTLVAYGFEDPAATAKAVHEFAKEHEALVIKESLMRGGKRISPEEVEALAKLPSREVLLGMLAGAMAAPARGFVSAMAAIPRGLVNVLAAVEKKKTESGEG